MLKHQLKATFLMQKHQMHWRHEKEAEQLRKFQGKKMSEFEKDIELQRRFLPKVCITCLSPCEAQQRRKYGRTRCQREKS